MTPPSAFLASADGCLEFLGRSLTVSQLATKAETLAGRLAASAPGPGRTVGLLLPDSPGLVAAGFAILRLGGRPLLLDPAAPAAAQAAALAGSGAALLLTYDLRLLIDQALTLVAHLPELRVGLLRASEELPFPRNLLEPLLRGGRFGQRPAHPGFFRVAGRPAPAGAGASAPEATRLLLSDGEAEFAELLAQAPERQERQPFQELPLHTKDGFAGLLACLAAGGSYRISASSA